eukprot:NODE_15_length_42055_cov_0.634117.p7 type:complete len:662 gc:universal NODE_15_length_42055_cov_0.634117:41309-39324(-)
MDLTELVEKRKELTNQDIKDLMVQLNTSSNGISTKSVSDRVKKYGSNIIPQQEQPSFLRLVKKGFDDTIIRILTASSMISLGTGLYEYFVNKVEMAYAEGLAIGVTVIMVVFINAYQDYQKNKQFQYLSEQTQSNLKASVVRTKHNGDVESSRTSTLNLHIPTSELVVGDIVKIQNGDIIPADGYLLSFSSLKIDESSLTGESDHVTKTENNRYVISGSQVVDGIGVMVLLAVGVNSQNGKLLLTVRRKSEPTPLQNKLSLFGKKISKFGIAFAVLIFIISLGNYFYYGISDNLMLVFQSVLHFLINAITIIVVAVPEGLPMAVTLSLSFATVQMMKDNNLVRVLSSCETMGNATTICSDKTGTLTQNKMTVLRGYFDLEEYKTPETDLNHVHDDTLQLVTNCVNINSTAYETENEIGKIEFVGSKTEIALLNMCKPYSNYAEDRKSARVLKVVPFASDRKRMSTIVALANDSIRLYSKGASEIILSLCTSCIRNGNLELLSDSRRAKIHAKIDKFANYGLRTIALGFKSLGSIDVLDESNMTFIGIVGIQDPIRVEVPNSVLQCQSAGIVVRMVTGDNLKTAMSIAKQCHIFQEDNGFIAMEGPEFRLLPETELLRIVPNLRVLARSSPSDKEILVHTLKWLGECVAVTGDGILHLFRHK